MTGRVQNRDGPLIGLVPIATGVHGRVDFRPGPRNAEPGWRVER